MGRLYPNYLKLKEKLVFFLFCINSASSKVFPRYLERKVYLKNLNPVEMHLT